MHLTPPHPFLLLLLPLSITAQSTISTLTSPAPSASAQYTSDSTFQAAILSGTNFYRSQHNATAVTWNSTSADFAKGYAGACVFKHSGNPTGENLAAGYPNASTSIDAWGQERLSYNFAAAQFSEATGHFTQLVWKATTSVGCGRADCEGVNGVPGWYVVCEYFPQGNIIGDFAANVQAQVSGRPGDTAVASASGNGGASASSSGGASSSGSPTATGSASTSASASASATGNGSGTVSGVEGKGKVSGSGLALAAVVIVAGAVGWGIW